MLKTAESSVQWSPELEASLESAKGGDRLAYAEIYKALYGPVTKYLYYKTGRREAVEDLASEVFLAAWRGLPKLKDGYFPGFVFRIARNQAVGEIRRAVRDRKLDLRMEPGAEPEDSAERDEQHRLLHHVLGQLKPEQKDVIVMKYLLGMTNSEVAKSLDKSENAVNAQQHRALKTLSKLLEKHGVSR